MYEDSQGNLRRDLTEKEFLEWKESWLREKGCPFFTCSQALYRKVCGSTLICGGLFDYTMYKSKPWIKVCDVELATKEDTELPTKSCPACTGSMCLKVDDEHDILIGKSFCKWMNDYYETKKFPVDRSTEKYLTTWGAYLIPIVGEEVFLILQNDPSIIERFQKEIEDESRRKAEGDSRSNV